MNRYGKIGNGHHFEITVDGNATPEAQVKYLQAVVKIHLDKISDLQLEIETLRLEKQCDLGRLNQEIDFLIRARQRLLQIHLPPVPRKPWWKRIWP